MPAAVTVVRDDGRVSGAANEAESTDDGHWLIERRLRVYPRIIATMLALAVPLYALTFSGGLDFRRLPPGTDFIAFWAASRLALHGHAAQAYDIGQIAHVQYAEFPHLAGPVAWVYPPPFFLLVLGLGLLPYLVAFLVWTTAGVVAYLAALRPLLPDRRAWWLAAAFPGLWFGIPSGQTQFFTAALTGGALLLLPRRPGLAGILIGLLVFKPQLAILFPVVLIAGRAWRAFTVAAVTALGLCLASLAGFGAETWRAWPRGLSVVREAIDAGALPIHKFVTPYTTLRLVGLPETAALALHVVVAAVALVTVWQVWRRTEDLALRGSALVLGTFLVTPYAADYDLAVLAFPIAWLGWYGIQHGWRRGERDLLVVLWLLPFLAGAVALATHVQITPVCLAFALWGVRRRTGQAPVAKQPPIARHPG